MRHSSVTATMLVLNDIVNALDKKQHYALCVDLSKAFDFVDRELMPNTVGDIGIGNIALKWFRNYLTECTLCVFMDGLTSDFKRFQRLSPRFDFSSSFISVFIKNIVKDLRTAKLHLYADDTVT